MNYLFKSFAPTDGSTLKINGYATFTTTSDGGVARLTTLDPDVSSSIFTLQPTPIAGFSTYFSFRISGGTKSEGFAFVIAPTAQQRGGSGGDLGYSDISSSIAIEFDTNMNTQMFDPNANHVGLMLNGNPAHSASPAAAVTIPTPMNNGAVWHAWIDYTGTQLELRLCQTASILSVLRARPTQPTLAYALDIPGIVGAQQGCVGFTAANGPVTKAYHDILSWQYRDAYAPI